MRAALTSLGRIALIAAVPVVVVAAPALRGIMHVWRVDARTTHDMLSGRTAFDEGAIRNALQTYAADAGRIASQVDGYTSAGRDFKRRFVAFQADAQMTLSDLSERTALKADFSRLMTDCQSCHDTFNN